MVRGLVLTALIATLVSAGVCTAAPTQERMLFGVSLGNYWPNPANIASDLKYFQLLKDAGVTHFGLGFNWDNIEKESGKYALAQWDYCLDLAARFGLKVEGCIVGCPEWALPTSGDLGWLPVALNMPREDCIPDFERFVTMLAQRYKGKVIWWSFWNEPNGYNMAPTVCENDPKYPGKVAHYTKHLKIAYQALKKGDRDAIMACGGMDAGGRSGTWLEGLYANGAKDYMDAVAIHPYCNDPPYFDEEYVKKTRDIMDKHGDKDKPIWINEYGTYNPNRQLINTVFDTMNEKYPYVTNLVLHTFQDFYGSEGPQPWGLIDLQLNIKPTGGYEAFRDYPKPPRPDVPAPPIGDCSISGTVTDLQLDKPVAGTYVLTMPGAYYAQTDRKGNYTIAAMPEGGFTVSTGAPGFNLVKPVEVKLAGDTVASVDFELTRTVRPLAEGETFDPAKDSADNMRDNLVVNGSFDMMRQTAAGQIAVGWWPFNTVRQMTYTAGASVGGKGLSQMMGHNGQPVAQGIYQVIPTVRDQKYRLTFWFLYTGQGRIGDLNNCNRFGIDPGYGEWGTTDPNAGKKKFGFPATLRWWPDEPAVATGDPLHTLELAAECDQRSGGPGKGEGKWFGFSFDFVAKSAKTGIWFEAAASKFQRSRKYFDEISVVPVDERTAPSNHSHAAEGMAGSILRTDGSRPMNLSLSGRGAGPWVPCAVLVLMGATLSVSAASSSAAVVTIAVRDNVDGHAMAAVKVTIELVDRPEITDADGEATFRSLGPGVHTVHAAVSGYMDTWEPVEVKDRQKNDFTVYMAEEDPPAATQGLPPRAIPYAFGVNVHGHPVTEEVEAVARAGVKFHRLGMDQNLITNAHWKGYRDGKYVFGYLSPGGGGDGPVATVPAYLKRGVRVLAGLGYDCAKFKGVPKTDAERADWAEFCRQAALTFKGDRIIYELSNEPMWYTPNWNSERDALLYVLAAKAAADAIHAVDPGAIVCAPGGAFTDEYIKVGLAEVVDAYSDHFYTDGPPEVNSRAYQHVRELLAKHTHKPKPVPIINSEQGFSWQDEQDAGPNLGSEERHAQYMVRTFLVDLMNDCRLTCWYDWNHLAGEPAGYKGAHASPQALQAFKTLVTELDGYRYLYRMDKGAGNFVPAFQKSKSRRYAASSVGNPTVEILIIAPRAEVVSLKGDSRTRVEAPGGTITITLDGSVQYVEPVEDNRTPGARGLGEESIVCG